MNTEPAPAADRSAATRSPSYSSPHRTGGGEGMDRRITSRFWTPRRLALAGGLLIVLALGAWMLLSIRGGDHLRIDRSTLQVSTVTQGPFQEFVAESGTVQPRKTVFLDAVEGGRIEEVFVREGRMIEAGTPILRLSNNDLQLRLLSADAQRIEQINRLQDMRFRMDQNALDLRQQLADMDYQIRRLERDLARQRSLHEQQFISDQDFEQVQDEYDYYVRNRQLTLEAYEQDSLRMAHQVSQMAAAVERMETNYEVLQGILDHLVVRAPVTGQLTSLDAEVGELRPAGSRFGQIDVTDAYEVRAMIDEYYLARVQPGQRATTSPLAGTEYTLEVTKVYPEVTGGRFEVELAFVGGAPKGVRRGQTIRFRLELGQATEATLLPRGSFYQSTGGQWVYVLGDNGTAIRRPIRIGRQNPDYFEVRDGLAPGDRVVTSAYERFGDAERLALE